MNSQLIIAEQLTNDRRNDLLDAAEDGRVTKVSVGNGTGGRIWNRLIDLVRLDAQVNPTVAQSTATVGRAPGN